LFPPGSAAVDPLHVGLAALLVLLPPLLLVSFPLVEMSATVRGRPPSAAEDPAADRRCIFTLRIPTVSDERHTSTSAASPFGTGRHKAKTLAHAIDTYSLSIVACTVSTLHLIISSLLTAPPQTTKRKMRSWLRLCSN